MTDTRAIKPEDNKGGTFTQLLSAAEVTTAYVSPVPAEAPGVITAEPGTVNEEAIYFKSRDAGAGTVSGLVRDYTNLNGGTGIQHENGEDWEVFQSALYIKNIVDILTEGFLREQMTVARVDADEFTVVGNFALTYTAGRLVRFNADSNEITTVITSSYSAGTGLTTVQVSGTIPDPLTSVEYGLQAKTAAYLSITDILDEDDFASDSATKPPSQQSTKYFVSNHKKTIVLPAAGMKPTTTAGCAAIATVEAATNDVDYNVLDFDQTTQEHAFCNFQMPDSWNGGTLTAKFIWTTAASSGNVIWGIKGRAYANDDAMDQAEGTAVEVTDAFIAAADIHESAFTSAMTLAGAPAGGQYVHFKIYRKAADGSDTLNGDARLIAVVLEYTVNSITD